MSHSQVPIAFSVRSKGSVGSSKSRTYSNCVHVGPAEEGLNVFHLAGHEPEGDHEPLTWPTPSVFVYEGHSGLMTEAVAETLDGALLHRCTAAVHRFVRADGRSALAQDTDRLWHQNQRRNVYLARLDTNRKREQMLFEYIDQLDRAAADDDTLDRSVLRRTRETWAAVRDVLGDALRVPLVGVGGDGSFLFTWRHGSDYLELQVETDGSRTLFYQDESADPAAPGWERDANWYDEAPAGAPLPAPAWDYLRRFVIAR